MKKQLFLLASVAVAMFSASCQREVVPTTPEAVQAAELHLTVQSVAPMTRTAVAAGDESKINYGTGFVFRGTDDAAVLDAAPFAINTLGHVTSTAITTAAKAVFLVTNTKNINFATVRTLGDLKALTSDLFDGETATQDKANLVMWGQAEVVVGTPYTATVVLRFAPAKVAFKYTLAASQVGLLTNAEVVVLNAQGTSRLFPAGAFAASKAAEHVSLMPGTPSYYAAIDMTGFGVENATVKDALLISNAAADAVHTFYLFENANESQSTIIALRGTYQGETYYYPVHFSDQDNSAAVTFEPILAGKSYEVAAKINHLSGGVTDPTNPVLQKEMEVTVVPAQWFTNVSWVKEFN